jgi:3'-phosphoadenosine 5'-phosphosulfate sulfotransferase (PAPS reductase)/FAD synthetase
MKYKYLGTEEQLPIIVASLSGGKDSVAMILIKDYKKAIFYDTGKEFNAIYNVIEKLRKNGIEIITLKPIKSFDYKMFDHCRTCGKNKGKCGYGWCGGICRWGTTEKLKELDRFAINNNYIMAVGIASDETKRIVKERSNFKILPLVDLEITEKECLAICRQNGIQWLEKTDSKFKVPEYIDLYNILDRVSCWCCRNKNLKELKNYYKYFTYSYWQKLKDLEQKIGVKMKGKKWLYEYENKWGKEIEKGIVEEV